MVKNGVNILLRRIRTLTAGQATEGQADLCIPKMPAWQHCVPLLRRREFAALAKRSCAVRLALLLATARFLSERTLRSRELTATAGA